MESITPKLVKSKCSEQNCKVEHIDSTVHVPVETNIPEQIQ